ncbi:hypothetical protein BDZ89DRAFT_1071641 [Hymenopellis radicata]|nr:hypothetical protein BDZ89DRAFT_1071641 [Hymenopellis radicata]
MKLTETLSAWVTIDGNRAEEYGVEISEEGRNATCWIASEVEKNFEISVEDLPMCPSAYRLKVDGAEARGKVAQSKEDKKSLRVRTWRGQAISPTEIRPFVFSPSSYPVIILYLLVSTAAYLSLDDDTLLDKIDFPSSQDLGTIVLYGGHCDLLKETQYKFHDISAVHSVHERMKKGVDHQITFGTPQGCASPRFGFRTKITGGEFSFTFKYRPLEPSQELENPNDAKECKSNVQEEHSSSDDDEIFRSRLTRKRELELEQIEDELRRHVKRKSQRRSQRSNVKQESAETGATGPRTKKVKRENVPSKAIMDVIDLTSD